MAKKTKKAKKTKAKKSTKKTTAPFDPLGRGFRVFRNRELSPVIRG